MSETSSPTQPPKNIVVGVVLTRNCGKTLENVYSRIPKEFLDDIIVTDDGSKDDTMAVAERLGLRSFTHPQLGYGGNLKFGLTQALKEGATVMIEIHGDGQYDPGAIPVALEKIRSGFAFVLGSRFTPRRIQPLRDGMPLWRYVGNRGLSFCERAVLGIPLTEFHTGFRAYTKTLLTALDYRAGSNDFLYSFEIIARARYHGLRVGEVPVRCSYQEPHTSISALKSAQYALQTFHTLFQYCAAKAGRTNALFPPLTGRDA